VGVSHIEETGVIVPAGLPIRHCRPPARLQYSPELHSMRAQIPGFTKLDKYLPNQNKRIISFIMQGKLPARLQYSPELHSMPAWIQASRNWIISSKSK
jgi:hypothetical protein